MLDLIKMISEWFDATVRVATSFFESISAFFIALSNIYVGIVESIGFFPSFLGGIMLSSFAILVLLRVIGR